MTTAMAEAPTVLRSLDAIARDIHGEIAAINAGMEHVFAAGGLLAEARQQLPDNRAFGRWCQDQHFAVKRHMLALYRRIGEHEAEARGLLANAFSNSGSQPAIATLAKLVDPPKPKRPDPLANVREHAAKQAQLNAAERAAANDRAVAAFLKRLDQIRGYFGTLTATTTQPVVIARFSAEGRDFATRRLADFQSEILALQTTLEETP